MSDFIVRTNLPDFSRQMAELSAKIQQRVVRSASGAAIGVLGRLSRKLAPVLDEATKEREPGTLRKAIYVKRSRRRSRGTERYYVGVYSRKAAAKRGRADAFYWRFLERGWIPRGPNKALRGGIRRKTLERKRLIAAGARRVKYPFFAPAFAQGQQRAVDAFYRTLGKRIAELDKKR